MSLLTTTPLQIAPPAAAGAALLVGAGIWLYGAWVEVITATATPIAIAGLQIEGGGFSDQQREFDIGVGPLGAEVSLGTVRVTLQNASAFALPSGVLFPVPLGGVPAGARVSLRMRANPLGTTVSVSLQYYAAIDSDHVTTVSQVLTSAPSGADSPTLTPSATPWAHSAWVELIASAPAAIALAGLSHTDTLGAGPGLEYDLGSGLAGGETVLTTIRDAHVSSRFLVTWLPGLYPLPAGTRVSVRMRKAGTSVTAHAVALIYYSGVSAPVGSGPVLAGELDRRTLSTATGTLNATWTGTASGNWTAGVVALKKT